jgi:hypothetical protein
VSRQCQREGCTRKARLDFEHCGLLCKGFDQELSRLQELYETAGDPTLSRDAWVSLVAAADAWTEAMSIRAKLYRDVVAAGLPLPVRSSVTRRSATPDTTART